MGIAVFLLLLFLAWAVVLPIWSLVASSRARMRAEEAERLNAERGRTAKAFARSALALEWNGKWRSEVPPASPGAIARPVIRPIETPAPLVIEAMPAREIPPMPELPPGPPLVSERSAPPPPIATPAVVRSAVAAAAVPRPARGSEAEIREAVARYSAWREHVRPFLIANIGWFISGFL